MRGRRSEDGRRCAVRTSDAGALANTSPCIMPCWCLPHCVACARSRTTPLLLHGYFRPFDIIHQLPSSDVGWAGRVLALKEYQRCRREAACRHAYKAHRSRAVCR